MIASVELVGQNTSSRDHARSHPIFCKIQYFAIILEKVLLVTLLLDTSSSRSDDNLFHLFFTVLKDKLVLELGSNTGNIVLSRIVCLGNGRRKPGRLNTLAKELGGVVFVVEVRD